MWRCEICRYDMQMFSHVIIFEELFAQALQMNLVGWKQKSGGKPTLVGKTMPETFKDQCKNHPESSSILCTMNNASIDAVQKSSNATSCHCHTKHHGTPSSVLHPGSGPSAASWREPTPAFGPSTQEQTQTSGRKCSKDDPWNLGQSRAFSASWHCKASFQPSQLAPIVGRIAEFKQKHETMEKHSKTVVFSNSSEQKETSSKSHLSQTMHCTKLHHAPPCTTISMCNERVAPKWPCKVLPVPWFGQCYRTVWPCWPCSTFSFRKLHVFHIFLYVLRIKMMKSIEICWNLSHSAFCDCSAKLLQISTRRTSRRSEATPTMPTRHRTKIRKLRSAPVGARSATRSAPQTEVKHDMCTTCVQHMCFICVSPLWNCWNMATGH